LSNEDNYKPEVAAVIEQNDGVDAT